MQTPLIHRTRGASRGTTPVSRIRASLQVREHQHSDTLTLSRGSGGTPYWASGCSLGAMFPTVRRPAPTSPARSAARGSYSRSVNAGAIVAAFPRSCQTESGGPITAASAPRVVTIRSTRSCPACCQLITASCLECADLSCTHAQRLAGTVVLLGGFPLVSRVEFIV
jgi:hypothetical protein